MTFVPSVGQMLTVSLPGEMLRAPVVRVLGRSTVFVRLDSTPLNPGKAHSYRLHDLVAVRRHKGELAEEWRAVDDRVLYARAPEASEPPLPETRKARVKTAPKRKASV